MKINEVAKLTGVTVRTLHYYDEIGLLTPSEITESGYRLYDETSLADLQQILFFRELDFPLADIRKIMANPKYDREEALCRQKELLLKKRKRLDELIRLLDDTLKGDGTMSFKEFDMSGIEKAKREYAAEVQERWGDTPAYAESAKRTASYGKEDWENINNEGSAILAEFGRCRMLEPDSAEAQALVKRWQSILRHASITVQKKFCQDLGRCMLGMNDSLRISTSMVWARRSLWQMQSQLIVQNKSIKICIQEERAFRNCRKALSLSKR